MHTDNSNYLISIVFLIFWKFCSASFGFKSLILASDLTSQTDNANIKQTAKNTVWFHFIFVYIFFQARDLTNFFFLFFFDVSWFDRKNNCFASGLFFFVTLFVVWLHSRPWILTKVKLYGGQAMYCRCWRRCNMKVITLVKFQAYFRCIFGIPSNAISTRAVML